ncbi:magnesium/cobalt transporter CorA [Luteolibacter luteus]|uniref:Magnesium transport protein CorA n=1 Tax=Luteolibacter luteus TaxID=2728835 RepID=A0A858RH29_9BACT|nr:magnesium/cobalt transporter CorA [Luteolibacter luteus]QJE95580.1 magnesium/cobalt transporter CorA [Luteolibacter luteus]
MLKRHFAPGASPATLVPHTEGEGAVKPRIHLLEYDANSFAEHEVTESADLLALIDAGKITWINIDGLGDIDALELLARKYGLHPLALEDVLNTGQRPKVEEFQDHLFIVAQMVYQDATECICGEQVSIFLGKNYVITVQEEPEYDVFNPVRERLRAGRGSIRKSKADYLAYALLDSIIDHYFPVLDELGRSIEDLEDQLLENPERSMVLKLHEHRRSLTQLRRYVWPLRDLVNGLLHDNSGQIKAPTKVFLRDCYDHTVQLMDFVESYKEITTGLMELYHSSVGLRTNEVMRVLTVITSIFIPLTFIVGVYGMNFSQEPPDNKTMPLNMPELYSPHGYIVVMGVMLVIAVAQLVFFRRKGWL